VAESLQGVMQNLRKWSKENFGSVTKELERLCGELESLQLANSDRMAIRAKIQRMDELLYREEMMWLQRSRISW
jgi:hypothetical protein